MKNGIGQWEGRENAKKWMSVEVEKSSKADKEAKEKGEVEKSEHPPTIVTFVSH